MEARDTLALIIYFFQVKVMGENSISPAAWLLLPFAKLRREKEGDLQSITWLLMKEKMPTSSQSPHTLQDSLSVYGLSLFPHAGLTITNLHEMPAEKLLRSGNKRT